MNDSSSVAVIFWHSIERHIGTYQCGGGAEHASSKRYPQHTTNGLINILVDTQSVDPFDKIDHAVDVNSPSC
jgi:hypothetical protein